MNDPKSQKIIINDRRQLGKIKKVVAEEEGSRWSQLVPFLGKTALGAEISLTCSSSTDEGRNHQNSV